MNRFFCLFCVAIISTFMIVSCGKKEHPKPKYSSSDSILVFVDEKMNDIYFWQEQMTRVDWHDYTDPADMMSDMIYESIDHWSSVFKKESLKSFFTGESVSYGFMPFWNERSQLYVGQVYHSSEAYRLGLRRGFRIIEINGRLPKDIYDWDFFNYPSSGETIRIYATSGKDTLNIKFSANNVVDDKVMFNKVFDIGTKKAGYVVYESFTTNSKDSLLTVMEGFRQQGVNELIIDLRYNGGGEVSVLLDWMSKIMPTRYRGKPFFITKHNSKNAKLNNVEKVYPDAGSLAVERVFVISTEHTASASEALINGLKPYIEVHHIGSSTHGKPVGMYEFEFNGWYVMPIAFEYTNALGDGGFYDGIEPEQYAGDDLSYDWGNPKDPCLSQALHYIANGRYQSTVLATSLKQSHEPVMPIRGFGFIAKLPNQLGK